MGKTTEPSLHSKIDKVLAHAYRSATWDGRGGYDDEEHEEGFILLTKRAILKEVYEEVEKIIGDDESVGVLDRMVHKNLAVRDALRAKQRANLKLLLGGK